MRRNLLLLDTLILLLAMAYITLGADRVPFHGDESTTIWMSRDYDTAILQRDSAALGYEAPARRTTDQHMRVITGNFSKLLMGAAWSGAGMQVEDINDQWVWGLDMGWNRQNGHVPSERLLTIARLTSAWLTALGAVLLLACTQLIARHYLGHPLAIHGAGWGAVLLYTLNPAILLHGRRAMFDAGLLFGLLLVVWVALRLLLSPRTWRTYLVAGLFTGLALTTKHTAAFTVVLLYAALGMGHLFRREWPAIRNLALATVTALITIYALTPLWWSAPFDGPRAAIDERQKILDEQVAFFGGYTNTTERLTALWDEALHIAPQYYEADYWASYSGVQAEIDDYQHSGLAGWRDDIGIFALRLLTLAVGLWLVIRNWRTPTTRLLLVWLVGILLITLVSVPLQWQRYYLPIQPPLIILMGLGLGALIESRGARVIL